MAEQQQRDSLCPRLIDYLAIVGARSAVVTRPGNASGTAGNAPGMPGAGPNAPPPVQVR